MKRKGAAHPYSTALGIRVADGYPLYNRLTAYPCIARLPDVGIHRRAASLCIASTDLNRPNVTQATLVLSLRLRARAVDPN
jgi:hypothetical protein